MKQSLLIFVFFMSSNALLGQLHDNTWMFGYNNNADTTDHFGISVLTFYQNNLRISQNPVPDIEFNYTETTFSDSSGNLLFFSNGVSVYDRDGAFIENGENLIEGDENSGGIISQYVTSVPWPEHANKFLIFYQEHVNIPGVDIGAKGLFYAILDFSENSPTGNIISTKTTVINDTLWLGHVIPVRHANGRDWWLLMNEFYTNRYYVILIDPEGVHVYGSQAIGNIVYQGVGQSCFSPDGKTYCSFNAVSQQIGTYLDIYDFNRCTGELSNHRQKQYDDWRGGVCISPNSRYLYMNYGIKAYQYDLQAPDIFASRVQVAEWDSTYSPFAAGFGIMQLAPDGKIYSETVSSTNLLNVIHNPDEAGAACNYEHHGIHLPTYNAFTMPSFPDYRMGPLDGSPCDTLGINNDPVAAWRSDQDTLNELDVQFTDLSYHEPATWFWDFGDGSAGSSERHPEHVYAVPGAYTVCLTVSNTNGSNTFCRKLFLGVTAQDNPVLQAQIQVSPNPFRDHLSVALSAQLRSPELLLFDVMGHLVTKSPLRYGITDLDTSLLPRGIYFWTVSANGVHLKSGKVVKVE